MTGADAERWAERLHNHEEAVVESRLRALYHPPEPDPAFVTRLEEGLMLARPVVVPISGLAGPTTPNGRIVPAPGRPGASPPPDPNLGRRHWVLTLFATAALLVVTLGLSYAAFGPGRLRPVNPITLPAFVQGETPVGANDTRFSVAFPVPVFPPGPAYAWSTLYEVDPGVSAAYPGFDIDSPVAAFVWVQSGTMAIDGEPITVHRAAAGAPGASPMSGELLLGAGDAVAVELGPGRSYHMRSVGPEPLVFAEFWIVGGPRPRYTYPPEYQILDFMNHDSAAILTSTATVTMRLSQVVLAPDETLAPDEGNWQLALADRPSDSLIARQSSGGGLVNMGEVPVGVVVMTAEFQEAGTPTVATTTG